MSDILYSIFCWATLICVGIAAVFVVAMLICMGVDALFHEKWDDANKWTDKLFDYLDAIPHIGRYVTVGFIIVIISFVGIGITCPKKTTEEYRITEQNEEKIVLEKEGSDMIYVVNLKEDAE